MEEWSKESLKALRNVQEKEDGQAYLVQRGQISEK